MKVFPTRAICLTTMVALLLCNLNLVVAARDAFVPTSNLKMSWSQATGKGMPLHLVVDKTDNNILYAALKTEGLAVYGLSGGTARLISKVVRKDLGNLDLVAITQVNNLLYLALGDFFKARGAFTGLAVVDISDAKKPKVVSFWKTPKKLRGATCLCVDGDYLYLGALSEGLFIFGLKNDPEVPKLITRFRPDIHFPKKNPGRVAHPNVRDLKVRGNKLYVAYDAGGLRVLDITNKKTPFEVGRYINSGMLGKAQAYNGIALDFPLAYLTVDYAGLEVVDISKPDAIRQIGWWNKWRADSKRNIWFNSPGHTNQIVFDKDREKLFVSAGASELLVFDLSDRTLPRLKYQLGRSKNRLGVWSVAKSQNQIYLGYIKAFIPFRGTWNGIKCVIAP